MLPHGVAAPKQRRQYYSTVVPWMRTKDAAGNAADLFGTSRMCLLILMVAIPSFLFGTTVSLYAGVDCTAGISSSSSGAAAAAVSSPNDQTSGNNVEAEIQRRVKVLLREKEEALVAKHTELVSKMVQVRVKEECGGSSGEVMMDPDAVGNMVAGVVLTPKSNFTQEIDLGVPLDKLKKGSDHVLMLYSSPRAMPKSLMASSKIQRVAPKIKTSEALENCEYLKVLLLDHSAQRKQCLALVPQYESYHVQNWMRAPIKPYNGHHSKLDGKEPLHLVSRGLSGGGKEEFPPPKEYVISKTFEMLKKYLTSLDSVLEDLKTIIKNDMKPYDDKTIIVMVSNFGQSELLMNFVCDAKAKKLDTSAVLVFATDRDTEELAKSLGLAAYYDEHNFGGMPAEAARSYGDTRFSAMMVAKVVCVQLISYLGYDLLFQDVDIVWYKHPLRDYFHQPGHWSLKYDAIFQDDGGHSIRYAPYSANSGFYFVRNNLKTRSFLNTLLFSSSIVLETDSHQQGMIAVLNEHVSLYGMQVKVVSRDSNDLPGGYQWNMKSGKYMKAFFRGEIDPVIFHMSWTLNKDNKLKYFQQMGSWHVQDKCISKKKSEIPGASNDLLSTCCSAEPIFKCHYRDKPSLHPCKESPPIDKDRPSFW